jgi:hypothetical protein
MNKYQHQEILATLSNPKWKTEMHFDLINAQSKQDIHTETMESICGLKNFYHQIGDSVMEGLMAGCEAIYKTGYDL